MAAAALALGLALGGLAFALGLSGGAGLGDALVAPWAIASARRASLATRRWRSLALRRLFLWRVAICLARRLSFLSRRCPIEPSFHRHERTGNYTAPRRRLQPEIQNWPAAPGRIQGGSPTLGIDLEFRIIFAVVLGGLCLRGGFGSVVGSVLALAALVIAETIMMLQELDWIAIQVITGAGLLLALLLSQLYYAIVAAKYRPDARGPAAHIPR